MGRAVDMNDVSTAQPAEVRGRFRRYEGPIAVAVALVLGLTLVSVLRGTPLIVAHSLVVNIALTTAALVVAVGAAYFALTEFVLYGMIASLLVALAFVLLAAASIGTGLAPEVGAWHGVLNAASVGWAVQRVVAGVLLVGAGIYQERLVEDRRRVRLGASMVVVVCLLAFLLALRVAWPDAAQPPRLLERALQALGACLYFAAALLFWRAASVTGRSWFAWLTVACLLGGFAQVNYAVVRYSSHVVQIADLLWLLFFTVIVVALLREWGRGYGNLRRQTRELTVLQALMTVASIHHSADVLEHACAVVADALQGETEIVLTGTRGRNDAALALVSAQKGLGSFSQPQTGQSGLVAAIEAHGELLGAIVVMRPASFTPRDWTLLRALAGQTALLLERSRLYEEVAAAAVVEERSRLAREIHDGMAQHLAFLKMRVQWLQRSPSLITAEQLRDMEGVLATALAEARHAISTLRADAAATNTADAVLEYAEEFSRISGLELQVGRAEDLPDVGPRARVELLRIIQEALNNVRKHAHSTRVRIYLHRLNGGLCARVEDDGVGFPPGQSPSGHFGLDIMRERAEAIGGTLSVQSLPGRGTEVCVWVPIQSDVTRGGTLTG